MEQKEARRLAAARDLRKGMPQVEITRKYGASPQAVHQWKKRLDTEGKDALRCRPKTDQPVKLSDVRVLLAHNLVQCMG